MFIQSTVSLFVHRTALEDSWQPACGIISHILYQSLTILSPLRKHMHASESMETTHCAPRRLPRAALACLAFCLLGIALALSLIAPIVMPLPTGICLTVPAGLGLPWSTAPGGATAMPMPLAGRTGAGFFGGRTAQVATTCIDYHAHRNLDEECLDTGFRNRYRGFQDGSTPVQGGMLGLHLPRSAGGSGSAQEGCGGA